MAFQKIYSPTADMVKATVARIDGISDHIDALTLIDDIDYSLSIIGTHIVKLETNRKGFDDAKKVRDSLYGFKAYDHATALQNGCMMAYVSIVTCFTIDDASPLMFIVCALTALLMGYMMNILGSQHNILDSKRAIQLSIMRTYMYNIAKEEQFIDTQTRYMTEHYQNRIDGKYLNSDFTAWAKDYLRDPKHRIAGLVETIDAYEARNTETESDKENTDA